MDSDSKIIKDNDPTNPAEHGQGMVTSVADFVTGRVTNLNVQN